MVYGVVGPADANYVGIPGPMLMLVLLVLALSAFAYIIYKRFK